MSEERRRFFRIDDQVRIRATIIPSEQLEDRIQSFWADQLLLSARNNTNHDLEEHLANLHSIENKMPELARYLATLQKQIDLLNEKLLPNGESNPTLKIAANISAQGIAYYSNEAYKVGDMIDFTLQLLPSRQQLQMIARVVFIEKSDNKPGDFKVSLNYEHIYEQDRESLVRHIHNLQMHALGASRHNEDHEAPK